MEPRGHFQPIGVWGELWLGGVQVARGYLHRPELSAERFAADPWPSTETSSCGRGVAYRTGDRVRWYADGELEFGGRIDFQVKLRGQRLELGEIEHALRAQPGVVEAVVLLVASLEALVAYVSPSSGIDEERRRRRRRRWIGMHSVCARLLVERRTCVAAFLHGAVDRGGHRRVAAHKQRQDRSQASARAERVVSVGWCGWIRRDRATYACGGACARGICRNA